MSSWKWSPWFGNSLSRWPSKTPRKQLERERRTENNPLHPSGTQNPAASLPPGSPSKMPFKSQPVQRGESKHGILLATLKSVVKTLTQDEQRPLKVTDASWGWTISGWTISLLMLLRKPLWGRQSHTVSSFSSHVPGTSCPPTVLGHLVE